MQVNFGTGQLYIKDSTGKAVQIGVLKDVSVNIKSTTKKLQGAKRFPVDVAVGPGEITGKAKSGTIYGSMLAALLAGSTIAAGQTCGANDEQHTIPSVTAYTVDATQETWSEDGGVYDYTAGKWLSKVASNPAAGQYMVADGTYTFAAADASHLVGLYYKYTATTGHTVELGNPLMGSATMVQLNVFNTYKGKASGYTLWACVFPSISWDNKVDDYTEYDMEFEAAEDPTTGKVVSLYVAE